MRKLVHALVVTTAGIGLATSFYFSGADSKTAFSQNYQEVAEALRIAGLESETSWRLLSTLTERFPGRVTGSAILEEAILWAKSELKAANLANVRLQPVVAPKWTRGQESLVLHVGETSEELDMLGLGMSVGTEALRAEAVVIDSFEAFEALPEEAVRGKIVVFNAPFTTYRETVAYRIKGADVAAGKGAVAVLVRTIGSVGSHRDLPHTGTLRYSGDVKQLPGAALSFNAADKLASLAASSTPFDLTLTMGATLDETGAPSNNVLAEITGKTSPEEILVFGGHIDSWDMVQGAHDDGAGVAATMTAIMLLQEQIRLKRLEPPRRTLRLVLWTNEENGTAGGKTYAASLSPEEVARHVCALEMDGGGEEPFGFGFTVPGDESTAAYERLAEIMTLLRPLGAHQLSPVGSGADIAPLGKLGVPTASVNTVMKQYFDWHHSVDDTLDKVDPEHMRRHSVAIATLLYVLADMPENLRSMSSRTAE